jgi:hypothetical protein
MSAQHGVAERRGSKGWQMQWQPKAEHAIIPYICGGELARRVYTYVREERSGLVGACLPAYVTEPADCGRLARKDLSVR